VWTHAQTARPITSSKSRPLSHGISSVNIHAIAELVEKSLTVVETTETEPRLRLLETTRFRRSYRTTLGKEILDVSTNERETQVEPDSMLDDDRGKRWRRYEVSAIASAYLQLAPEPAGYPDKAAKSPPASAIKPLAPLPGGTYDGEGRDLTEACSWARQ
jgi:hypothetical protein